MIQYYILGIILITAGVINYSINRRRFYRRSPDGLQLLNLFKGGRHYMAGEDREVDRNPVYYRKEIIGQSLAVNDILRLI